MIDKYGKKVFDIEIQELINVKNKIDERFISICKLFLSCKGKIVVTGIGKSGIIGKKIASTFASTGTNAVFMHSAEGLHGDLGIVKKEDIVLAISNSGNTEEVLLIIPSIKQIGAKVVSMTGNIKSKLAICSDYILDIQVSKEACPMNLAPTCSTTVAMVMGDALASVLIKLRNFKPENFAVFHPGGSLGRRLLTKVKDVMKKYDTIAISSPDDSVEKVILSMTEKNLGASCIVDDSNNLIGLITEGDLRRALTNRTEFFNYKAKNIMNYEPEAINEYELAITAMELMEKRDNRLSVLPVLNNNKLVGLIRVHDILF